MTQLKTLILDIEKYNATDYVDDFVNATSFNVVLGIDNYLQDSIENAAFLVTDNRYAADKALKNDIGIAVYINGENNAADFSEALYCIEEMRDMSDVNLERMYNRFIEKPWDIVETERCIVREITLDDIDGLYEIYSDEETKRYIEDLYEDREEEERFTKDYIANQYRFYEYGLWAVVYRETGRLIGRAGLFMRENQEYPELGFVFDRTCWGKGIAYEVLLAILKYARDELYMNEICAHTDHNNTRSERILRKLGFEYTCEVEIDEKKYDRYVKSL